MARMLDGDKTEIDQQWDATLRPHRFDEFPGQDKVKEKLRVFVQAAVDRLSQADIVVARNEISDTGIRGSQVVARDAVVIDICTYGICAATGSRL